MRRLVCLIRGHRWLGKNPDVIRSNPSATFRCSTCKRWVT